MVGGDFGGLGHTVFLCVSEWAMREGARGRGFQSFSITSCPSLGPRV